MKGTKLTWEISIKVPVEREEINNVNLKVISPILEKIERIKKEYPDRGLQVMSGLSSNREDENEDKLSKYLNICYGIYPIVFVLYIITFVIYIVISFL